MREPIDSYYIIMMDELYLTRYEDGATEFSEHKNRAFRYSFDDDDTIVINGNDIKLNPFRKSEVFSKVLDVLGKLNNKGFRNLKYIERHTYIEETSVTRYVESVGKGIRIRQDEE